MKEHQLRNLWLDCDRRNKPDKGGVSVRANSAVLRHLRGSATRCATTANVPQHREVGVGTGFCRNGEWVSERLLAGQRSGLASAIGVEMAEVLNPPDNPPDNPLGCASGPAGAFDWCASCWRRDERSITPALASSAG